MSQVEESQVLIQVSLEIQQRPAVTISGGCSISVVVADGNTSATIARGGLGNTFTSVDRFSSIFFCDTIGNVFFGIACGVATGLITVGTTSIS